MKCKFCGEEIPDNARFCSACGVEIVADEAFAEEARQVEEPEQEVRVEQPDAPAEAKAAPKASKKTKRIAAILGCVAGMLVLALVLAIGLGGLTMDTIKGWFDWELFRDNDIYKQNSYTVSDKKAQSKGDTVVATLGDAELTNSQLQVFYWTQVYDFLNSNDAMYAVYQYKLDYTKPFDEQVCTMYDETLTWQQYFLTQALYTWRSYQSLYDEALANDFELPEEYRTILDELESSLQKTATQNNFATVDDMLKAEFGAGVGYSDYRYYLERYFTGNLYFNELADKLEATDEELEAYFKENEETLSKYDVTKESGLMLDARKLLVSAETSKDADGKTVITEEAWAACQKKAQELFDGFLGGEQTEDAFSTLVQEKSDDKDTASSGGLMQYISKGDLTTIDVRHILIKASGTEDADGNITFADKEAADKAKAKAEQILQQWQENPTQENFAALAKENSEDGNAEDGGLYENVTYGYMVASFNDWCFDESRVAGETGIVVTKYGYHVMYFVGRDDVADEWLFADGRKAGDTTLIKTDDGYMILYYVMGEDGWIRYCRNGVLNTKASALLEQYAQKNTPEISYGKICLAEVSLGS